MLENRRCLLPVRLTHGPTLLGILTATLVTLLIQSLPLNAQESQYSGQGSYAIYPAWTGPEMQEGLLQVTFRTPVGEGLLLYAEGTTSMWAEALAVMLEGGRIVVRVQRQQVMTVDGFGTFPTEDLEPPEEFFVSENLNDNMTHTLSLQQTPNNFMVSVLDRSASGVSPLLSRMSNIGSMEIYIGGLPINQSDAHIRFSISDSFSGCIVDVQSSNGSTNASSLVSVSPIERQGVVDGCPEFDPCVGVSCGGGGSCVPLPPNNYYCDCTSTPFAGPNCTEDLSMHRLSLTLDSYLCYDLSSFSSINSAGSVRLPSPLPQAGSIMTGVSSGGQQFNLYLEDGILKLELISGSRSVELSTSQVLDSSTSYQVKFEIGSDRVDLILEIISESGDLTEIERSNGIVSFPVPTSFTTVCVGGSMLEIPYYTGTLERVIYNIQPLSSQSFMQQHATVETPVNLISVSEDSDTPLTFRLNLADNYQRITFEIRVELASNGLAGTPLSTRGNELQFTVFNNFFAIISIGSSFGLFVMCPDTAELDSQWHRIDIILSRNDGIADLYVTVDEVPCAPLTNESHMELGRILDSLINSSNSALFDFAATHTSPLNPEFPTTFVGCLRNIEFTETANSEPVRPDLASAIRAEERFRRGEEECNSCRTDKTTGCSNAGEVCADCGYLYPAQCLDSLQSCPDESRTTPTTIPSTSVETTTPTMITGTTDDSTSPTNPPPIPGTPVARTQLGLYIGIGIGGAAAIILAVIIVVFLLCFCVRVRAGGQGFYRTEESNGKALTMLHYSASLRQIASEQVTMAETNGVSPMHADGLRAKEFYM